MVDVIALTPARTHDVAIAGAGLVGATFALQLAAASAGKLKIALIEARAPAASAQTAAQPDAPFDSRVVALNEASRQFLDRIGVWQGIAGRRVCPYTRMEVRDSEGTGFIAFDCAELRAPDLGHIAENRVVLAALLERIAQQPDIDLRCPASISGITRIGNNLISLAGAGEQITTPLLVAADGARSPVREQLGFGVREWSYGHSAIVATIRTEKPHRQIARQWFTATGPLALLPLRTASGDCRYSSIVWSQQTAAAEALMRLEDAAFCQALGETSEHCLGTVTEVTGRECVPLHQRHAIDYIQPGVALIGDAAHSIHPLAGQGVNLGIADADVLVEELVRALNRGINLGDLAVLGRYQRRRKLENLAMMAAMEGFKRLFENPSPLARLLRNEGMSQLNALAPLKNHLIKQAMGH
ncbi:MAG: UbiH/UbiF/VisC/COQ6 family ubiquinone biosynthesis hydroxylase [Porticoccaceae bacterium]